MLSVFFGLYWLVELQGEGKSNIEGASVTKPAVDESVLSCMFLDKVTRKRQYLGDGKA